MKKVATVLLFVAILLALTSNFLLFRAASLSGFPIYDPTVLVTSAVLAGLTVLYATRHYKLVTYGLLACCTWAFALLMISIVTGFRVGQSIPHLAESLRPSFALLTNWSDLTLIASWALMSLALVPIIRQSRSGPKFPGTVEAH
jgi:hypothetical protein